MATSSTLRLRLRRALVPTILLLVAGTMLCLPAFADARPARPLLPGTSRHGLFFPPLVAGGAVPAPNDTIEVTATEPYLGQVAGGRGFVLLAPGHTVLTNPVLVVEGFDLDNSMDWDELYTLLNQEGLVESLLARGQDAVVLDFTDATDYIQRNAFVFTALLAQVEGAIEPGRNVAVVGPSMGGLVARYGLAWLEANAVPHRVTTFISFDAPQRGANIPLGLQHWVEFFSGQSTDAAVFRGILESPAARQMLVSHFTRTSGGTAAPDPLRPLLLAELAAIGDYPTQPRRVAFANGAGDGTGQGYPSGTQLIEYGYNNFGVLITGDVWAVPDGASAMIFDGRIRILFISDTQRQVTVSGTRPYDDAPGGWRASMAQLDTTDAPFGDIQALHDRHAFIPTMSALDMDDTDLRRDLTPLADPAGESPFDALHWQPSNEEHVFISAWTAARLRDELAPAVVGVSPDLAARLPRATLHPAWPNPSSGSTRLRFTLVAEEAVTLDVIDVAGRRVRRLAAGLRAAGAHDVTWDLHDQAGRRVRAGLYFMRLATEREEQVRRLVALP
ncbi:MAG: T9SS type A sorting domain-containing protein [Actinomycetota bacterium]|nr:T9SS type A sorting domain-containing protein [Actinomycetota bacterium]